MKISTKLFLFFMPTVVAGVTVSAIFSRRAVESGLLQEVGRKGVSLAENFLEIKELPGFLASKDEMGLIKILQKIQENSGALYAMALDPSGEALAHTDVAQKGKKYMDRVTQDALASRRTQCRAVMTGPLPVLDVAFPVWLRPVGQMASEEDALLLMSAQSSEGVVRAGTIRFGLPLDKILDVSKLIFRQILEPMAFAAAICLLLIMVVTYRFLRPIKLLSSALENLGRGRLGVVIPVTSGDEIGDLTFRFNEMSQELARTTVSKEFFQRYEFIANISKEMMTLIRRDYIYEAVNEAYCRAHKKTMQEITGKTVTEIWGRETFEALIRPNLDECLRGNEIHYQTWLEFPALGRLYVDISLYPYRNGAGEVTHAVVITHDITEQKSLEAQILQSEKLATVGQLAGGIAHEINNPLAGILTTAQLALSELPDSAGQIKDDLKTIEISAQRCKKIVGNLLGFSRANPFSLGPVSVVECLVQVLALLRNEAAFNHVQIDNKIGANAPLVQASLIELQQVLTNLILNAIQSMSQGGTLVIESSWPDQDHLAIHIRDSGQGIEPANLKKIFEPFFTTKPVGKGTGLGLPICLRIIQEFGGTLSIDSPGPGKGTTATVIIKLARGLGENLGEKGETR
ncbi:MAG: ATP-binding protein [Elusimicrobiota bacterium]